MLNSMIYFLLHSKQGKTLKWSRIECKRGHPEQSIAMTSFTHTLNLSSLKLVG